MESTEGKKNVYRVAKQMAKSRQDVVGVNCVKDTNRKVSVEDDQVKEERRKFTEKLLHENTRDNATTCEKVEGPCELIRRDEISKALRMIKKGKAGIVSEIFTADENCSVELLTSLCNLIVAQGRIPDGWKSSILLQVYKGKGDPMECGSYRAIKLLEHAMKVIERVFVQRIREKVKDRSMQFGFMPGKGTTDAIFTVGQMQVKYRCKERSSTLTL